MDELWKKSLWQQFGATLDMLDNALSACPDALWRAQVWPEEPGNAEFWYIGYHTLFWVDLYLTGAVEGFQPPSPFTLSELDPDGLLPDQIYTKKQVREYLAYCRQKCEQTIAALTDERAAERCKFGWGEASFGELLIYNMRHVQEHAAQLSLFLGQQLKQPDTTNWVAQARG